MPTTTVYTDGACVGNPGPGGWAWAIPGGSYASGAAARTTNQRMEIQAALEAVMALDGPLEIVSDSTYVVNCFRDRWWAGLAGPGLAQQPEEAGRQPRSVGAAHRRLSGGHRTAAIPVGQGPQRRPHERSRRPPRRRRRRHPAGPRRGRPRRRTWARPTVPARTGVTSARVGVDTGGTFTDVVTDTGEVVKLDSLPGDPAQPVAAGVARVGGALVLAHGTTVATNALLERAGGRVALISSEGQRDVIEIARQARPSLYDLWADRPDPLVARHLRFEVSGRLDATGREVVPLGPIPAIPADVDGVAVCLLHADRNPDQERAVAAALAGFNVVCSSDVSPEYREYERTVTTVADAYLRRPCQAYLGRLRSLAGEVLVMTSAGGLIPVAEAADHPVRLLLSGPAGGVLAAAAASTAAGFSDCVSFDMGGTSTDVCLIRGGRPEPAAQRRVAGLPIRMPALDVHTIGAGGGSIAAIDAGGALVVGPRSAGADPGPGLLRAGRDATYRHRRRRGGRADSPGWSRWPGPPRRRRRPSGPGGQRGHRGGGHRGRGSGHGAGRAGGVGPTGRRSRRPGPGGVRGRRPAARLRPGRGAGHAGGHRAAPGRRAFGGRDARGAPPGGPGAFLAAIPPITPVPKPPRPPWRARRGAPGEPGAPGWRRPWTAATRARAMSSRCPPWPGSRRSMPAATGSCSPALPSRWSPSGPRLGGPHPLTRPTWPHPARAGRVVGPAIIAGAGLHRMGGGRLAGRGRAVGCMVADESGVDRVDPAALQVLDLAAHGGRDRDGRGAATVVAFPEYQGTG